MQPRCVARWPLFVVGGCHTRRLRFPGSCPQSHPEGSEECRSGFLLGPTTYLCELVIERRVIPAATVPSFPRRRESTPLWRLPFPSVPPVSFRAERRISLGSRTAHGKKERASGVRGPERDSNYAYDAPCCLTGKTYPDSKAVNYSYDLLSRLTPREAP
jgi:YD repeat-containing protein